MTEQVVASLAAGSGTANAAAKRLIREAVVPAPESALRKETLSIRALAGSPDGREGVAAFVEKRAPRFRLSSGTLSVGGCPPVITADSRW
ncbi:hypothetical protein [Nocardioides convexus]|uniref:hypothetical protein n=1 Tax=Nocardioides convexus TaxID=2712224 RepID=UPI0024183ACA|nr:hypothetical protein [Nocardioides convexus]